ncbi:MAG: multicopper oxidase domain-containing protein, partial [Aestuariivirgaceae bacterium]
MKKPDDERLEVMSKTPPIIKANRREILQGSLALAAFAWLPETVARAESEAAHRLDIRAGQAELLDAGGPKTPIWGYDGQVPGPLLRMKRGQRTLVAVTNQLSQPTTVHWHGLRIENAMDGVSGLTQPPIAPGETFEYSFTPPDAGTHWYHSHHRGWEQVARGLYGPLIVEEDESVDVDRDLVIMADDWRLKEDGRIDEASLGNVGERAHGGRLGNVLTLNGKPYESLAVKSGERVRLRMINAANARIMQLRLAGLDPWLVALDGQPVKALRLAPAQRADLIFDVTAKAGAELAISEVSGQEPLVAGYLQVIESDKPISKRGGEPPVLPGNKVPVPDVKNARIFDLDMTGGAMRFLATAVYKGKTLDGRTLAQEHGQAWA